MVKHSRPVQSFVMAVALALVALHIAPLLCGGTVHAGAPPANAPRVIIDSSPPGAAVYVDGKNNGVQGYSGANFKLRMSKGPHRVLLELEGYKPVEQVINVTQAQKFSFNLDRAPAKLEVKTPGTNESARGAEVFVDGAPAGTVPVPIEIPSGRHLIEVRKPGFRVYSESVEVRAGDTRTLWVTLQSEVKNGSLLIAADANADVFVDGQHRGPAPVMVDNLPEGDHLIEVRRPEPGAPQWRQNIRVLAGQQVKVFAQTQGAAGGGGSLLVACPGVTDAEVFVDGAAKGKVNQEISGLRPGQHVVEVRVKGRQPAQKLVEIEAGKQRILQIDVKESAEARGVGILRVIMVNPVDGAQYFIDGRKYDEGALLSEKGVEVSAGHIILVVRKDGFGEVKRDLNIRPGGVETVQVELRNVGAVSIETVPPGADVILDGRTVGKTPYTAQDVTTGVHKVELRLADYQKQEAAMTVEGGRMTSLNVPLLRVPSAPEAKEDPATIRRGLSSHSAYTIEPGSFTTDVAAGYPYFFNIRLMVGVLKSAGFGLDAGAELRTSFYFTDVAANLRAQLLTKGPFGIGANLVIGGGGGPRGRNDFFFELGVPLTLKAGNLVKLTVRPYLLFYSDQLCPTVDSLQRLAQRNDFAALSGLVRAEHVGDRCTGGEDPALGIPINSGMGRYRNAIADAVGYYEIPGVMGQPPFGAIDPLRVRYDRTNPDALYRDDLTSEGNPVLERFTSARLMIQAIIEVAVTQSTNMFFLFEANTIPKERQLFTDRYNRVFPERDLNLYGRAGFTMKY